MYEEYQSYISIISSTLTIVRDNVDTYKTLCKLCGKGKPYEYIMTEHPLFWEIFINNLNTSIIINLLKILDNDKNSITITELIKMFNKDFPKQTEQIDKIANIQKNINKIIVDVKRLRNKRYAHFDKKYALGTTDTFKATWGNVEDLATYLEEIIIIISSVAIGTVYISRHIDLESNIEKTIKSFAHNANRE